MRWRFRNRLKSSQASRLRESITRAAAFWHHVVIVQTATSGRSASCNRGHSSDRSTPKPAG